MGMLVTSSPSSSLNSPPPTPPLRPSTPQSTPPVDSSTSGEVDPQPVTSWDSMSSSPPSASLLVLVPGSPASPSVTHALSSSDSSTTTTPKQRDQLMVTETQMVPQSPMTSHTTSSPPCTPTSLYQPSPSVDISSDSSSLELMKKRNDE